MRGSRLKTTHCHCQVLSTAGHVFNDTQSQRRSGSAYELHPLGQVSSFGAFLALKSEGKEAVAFLPKSEVGRPLGPRCPRLVETPRTGPVEARRASQRTPGPGRLDPKFSKFSKFSLHRPSLVSAS